MQKLVLHFYSPLSLSHIPPLLHRSWPAALQRAALIDGLRHFRTGHPPLPRHCLGFLLVVLIGLCIAATVLGALLPGSFPVDLASGVLIALQGLWFYQTAFTLYGPMLPAGCARDAGGHIECRARATQERAEQLANFQLFGLVFLAFVYALGCYAVAAARHGHRDLKAMHDEHVAAMEVDAGGAGAGGAQEECAI